MRLALLVLCAAAPAAAFTPPEHKELGDHGFAAAVLEFQRLEGRSPFAGHARIRPGQNGNAWTYAGFGPEAKFEIGWFSFGDMVAIYGDMKKSFGEFNSAQTKAHVQGLKTVAATGDYEHNKPERARMMELALTNETHFSGKAVAAYVRWHDMALKTAALPGQLWKALHYEALALHSLTDVFSVGHMLVDRDKTMALLAQARQLHRKAHDQMHQGLLLWFAGSWNFWRAKGEEERATLLYGFYANIYHNGFNHHGAVISNLRGDTWKGYGDHKLHWTVGGVEQTATQRLMARSAVGTSIMQVLKAGNGKVGHAPGHRYAALLFLPVRYRGAITSADPWEQTTSIVTAAFKQHFRFGREGGIDPKLLRPKRVPDGEVPYIGFVRQSCAAACAGR